MRCDAACGVLPQPAVRLFHKVMMRNGFMPDLGGTASGAGVRRAGVRIAPRPQTYPCGARLRRSSRSLRIIFTSSAMSR
jgi:hypothetical protein